MNNPNIALQQILNHWGLKLYQSEKVKDVYKVDTNQGIKNLKVSPNLPNRLIFVHHAIKHLVKKGFDKIYPLIPTLNGDTFVCDQHSAYSLFDWIEGVQCNFTNPTELIRSTKVLAEFHSQTLGFNPPKNSNMRNRLGKCLKHFEDRYQELLDFRNIARAKPNDPFSQVFLENVDFFLPMAQQAINKIKQSSYMQLVEKAMIHKPFCHGDPAARNFILTPSNEIYIIDFDSCRLDLPMMDLIKFSRRVMKKYYWDFEIAKLLIDAYQEILPLSQYELDVIKAVFYFPQKFWRLSVRYFHEHDRYTPESSLRKFVKYLRNKENMSRFQTQFEMYQSFDGE